MDILAHLKFVFLFSVYNTINHLKYLSLAFFFSFSFSLNNTKLSVPYVPQWLHQKTFIQCY